MALNLCTDVVDEKPGMDPRDSPTMQHSLQGRRMPLGIFGYG